MRKGLCRYKDFGLQAQAESMVKLIKLVSFSF